MNAPRFPGLISSPAAVCPSMLAPLANTRFLKLCDALATCRQRCEGRGICPGLRKAVGSALRPKVACTGAGTPLHCGISVPSMSESGQNPNASRTLVCQLPPAADIPSHGLWPASCRYCCKSLFALLIKNYFGCTRDFRVKMSGTSSPEDKLAGDLGNVIEAISNRRSSVGFFYGKKIGAGQFGTFATISALRSYAENDAQRPLLEVKADSHVAVR